MNINFHILLVIVVIGVIGYLVDRFIPMIEPIKTVFRIVVAVIAIWLLLEAFGVVGALPRF